MRSRSTATRRPADGRSSLLNGRRRWSRDVSNFQHDNTRESSSVCAAALWSGERELGLGRTHEIVMVAGARNRPHRRGVELAVLDEAVVDMHADDLPEHHIALGDAALEIGQ